MHIGAQKPEASSQNPCTSVLLLHFSQPVFRTWGDGYHYAVNQMKEEEKVVSSLRVRLYHTIQTIVTSAEACVTFG